MAQGNVWEFCSRDYAEAATIGAGSSAGASGYPVSSVIDGNNQTGWYYSGVLPATVILDLGLTRYVDRVFVGCAPFMNSGVWNVQTSVDGSSYSAVAGATLWGTKRDSLMKFTRVQCRYVKVTFTAVDETEPTELRVVRVAVFRKFYSCDGYEASYGGLMPFNPAARSGGRLGGVEVPLMGGNVRLQNWGGLREQMNVRFPMVNRTFLELLKFFEERGTAFGLVTDEFQFHNVIFVPNGLRFTALDSDGEGGVSGSRTLPSKSWWDVELDVKENYDATPGADYEPVVGSGELVGDSIDAGSYVETFVDVVDGGQYPETHADIVEGGGYS